ncbi:MAG: hypothetical protein Q9187_007284, partial [Circinaria calcarea]
ERDLDAREADLDIREREVEAREILARALYARGAPAEVKHARAMGATVAARAMASADEELDNSRVRRWIRSLKSVVAG